MVVDFDALRRAVFSGKWPFGAYEKMLSKMIEATRETLGISLDYVKTMRKNFSAIDLEITPSGLSLPVFEVHDVQLSWTVKDLLQKIAEKGIFVPEHSTLVLNKVLPLDKTLRSLGVTGDSKITIKTKKENVRPYVVAIHHDEKPVAVPIHPSDTVEELRVKITLHLSDKTPIRLVYKGKQLEDYQKVGTEMIGDKVYVLLRLRGGMYKEISGRNGFGIAGGILSAGGLTIPVEDALKNYAVSEKRPTCPEELVSMLEKQRLEALLGELKGAVEAEKENMDRANKILRESRPDDAKDDAMPEVYPNANQDEKPKAKKRRCEGEARQEVKAE